ILIFALEQPRRFEKLRSEFRELEPNPQPRSVVGEFHCTVMPPHDSSDEAEPEPVPWCTAAPFEPDKPVKDGFSFGFWNSLAATGHLDGRPASVVDAPNLNLT